MKFKIVENKYFDDTTTGMSFYDDGLRLPDYYKWHKGYDFKIVEMSPEEYLNSVKKIFGKPVVVSNNMDKNASKYANMMKNGITFPMPVLDYVRNSQEGRHRSLAAIKLGLEKIPVLVVQEHEVDFSKNVYK